MPASNDSKTPRSKFRWFVQGICIAFILFAGVNAASYFWRTDDIGPLFGKPVGGPEALGFPFEIWNSQHPMGQFYVDWSIMALNLLVGFGLSLLFGATAVLFSTQLEAWITEFEARTSAANQRQIQFSLTSLLVATSIVGVLSAFVTQWAGTRELLWFVYLFGPITLIGIAFLPRGINWQSRCLIVAIAAIVVCVGAVWSGSLLRMELDRVLMGIFVFWTPQSSFAVVILLTMIVAWQLKEEGIEMKKLKNTNLH